MQLHDNKPSRHRPTIDRAALRALKEDHAEVLRRARATFAALAPGDRGGRRWTEAAIDVGTQLAILGNRERALRGLPDRPLDGFVLPAGIAPRLGGLRLASLLAYHLRRWPPEPSPIVVPDRKLIVPGRAS